MTDNEKTANETAQKDKLEGETTPKDTAQCQPWSPRIPDTAIFLNSADMEKRIAESASEAARFDLEEEEQSREAAQSCADGQAPREGRPPESQTR